MHCSKDIHKLHVIFLREETAHVTEDETIFRSLELRAYLFSHCWVVAVQSCIYSIALLDHLTAILHAKQPITSFLTTREIMCGIGRQTETEVLTNHRLQIKSHRTIVCMGDAHWNTHLLSDTQREIAAFLQIGMDNPIFGMYLKKPTKLTLVLVEILRI